MSGGGFEIGENPRIKHIVPGLKKVETWEDLGALSLVKHTPSGDFYWVRAVRKY